VLLSLDESSAKSIKNAITLFENRYIQNYLAYIKCNFGLITQSILKLGNTSLLLDKNLEIVEKTKFKLCKNKGPIAEKIDNKLKNEDFPNITPGEVTTFKYAKMTSCE